MMYQDICNQIEKAPKTFLPALLGLVVRLCIRKNLYKDQNAMLHFVTQISVDERKQIARKETIQAKGDIEDGYF